MAFESLDFDFSSLTPDQRVELAHDLLESVVNETHAAVTPEQLAEMERRDADIDAGRVQCLSWESVRAKFLGGR